MVLSSVRTFVFIYSNFIKLKHCYLNWTIRDSTQSEFRVPGLERHTEKLFPFYLNYDKPCGELALGENCIKIISQDKSNSLGMFLEIHIFY